MLDWLRDLISVREVALTVFNVGFAALFGLLIAWVYRRTASDVLSPPRFAHNLVVAAMITAMVIMVIGGNLVLSLGLVGALSIVRFRAAIKDPRDIVFLFWAIAAGLAAGSGSYVVAGVGSIAITFMFLLLARGFAFVRSHPSYLVVLRGESFPVSEVEDAMRSAATRFKVRLKSTSDSQVEVIYELDLPAGDEEALLSRLRPLAPGATINLLSHAGESAL